MADVHRKYPIPTTEEEDIQQALGVLWAQFEQGAKSKTALEAALHDVVRPGILEDLVRGGYVAEEAGNLELKPKGLGAARDMARRHRLTERLLKDVLVLPKEQIDPNACRMEHVITSDVEEAICTLLGHPEACPHGLPIPKGTCCEKAVERTGPIVVPLSALASGQNGSVAYLSPQDRPELHRLLSMGLVPGASLHVEQTFPAWVIRLGETLLALDPGLARHIFVRRKNGGR